jgi:hypothetical protein
VSSHLNRSHLRKEFFKPTKIRYASYFLLLERMLEVQLDWSKWAESKTDEGKKSSFKYWIMIGGQTVVIWCHSYGL